MRLHDCLCPPPVTALGLGAPHASGPLSSTMAAQSKANVRHAVASKSLFNELKEYGQINCFPKHTHIPTLYIYIHPLLYGAPRTAGIGIVLIAHSLYRH